MSLSSKPGVSRALGLEEARSVFWTSGEPCGHGEGPQDYGRPKAAKGSKMKEVQSRLNNREKVDIGEGLLKSKG